MARIEKQARTEKKDGGTGEALFFSVTEDKVYSQLASQHRKVFPGMRCAFLGSTFGGADWRRGQKAHLLPTSRLLWQWVFMNERTERVYIPAIRSGRYDAVFVQGFGREAYLYAIRHKDCPQTLAFHKSLVESRLISQGGKAPTAYLTARPSDSRIVTADQWYFADPRQRIVYLEGSSDEARFAEAVAYVRTRFSVRSSDA